MTEAIRLYWGRFGHVSAPECRQRPRHPCPCRGASHHLAGRHGRRDDHRPRDGAARTQRRRRHQLLPAAQPCSSARRQAGPVPCLLHRSRLGAPAPRAAAGRAAFAQPAITLDPWLHRAAASLLRPSQRRREHRRPRRITRSSASSTACSTPPTRSAPRASRMRANAMQDFRVRKAIELMKANVCERICFDDVARSVGLSRPHFFALFKEQTNLTPNVYWNTLRMEEALRQLQWSRGAADLGRLQSRLHHPGQFHALLPRPCRRAADALPRGRAGSRPEPVAHFQTVR